MNMNPQAELDLFDSNNCWFYEYQKIKEESMDIYDFSYEFARLPDNRVRNRYGDVNPFDFNRIILERDNIDYINASCVSHPISRRSYILAQGPLPHTCGHFWLMIWEQNTPAILMLSKLVEKNMIKCHKYYPCEDDGLDNEMIFDDVRLKIIFVGIVESNDNFITRLFKLQDLETGETKSILQFHYISWPDFGVPTSPEAFLQYLYAVRKSEVLEDPQRQVVIHCSAGIGRSGTFCLVDICLHLLENGYEVDILYELMQLRKYRMGLIQTPEQLRFSYLAIVEGSKAFLNDNDSKDKENHNSEIDLNMLEIKRKNNLDALANEVLNLSPEENNYLLIDDPPISNGNHLNENHYTDQITSHNKSIVNDSNKENKTYSNQKKDLHENGNEGDDEKEGEKNGSDLHPEITHEKCSISATARRRARDERIKKTNETIEKIKQKQKEAEMSRGHHSYGLYVAGAVGIAFAIVAIAIYRLG